MKKNDDLVVPGITLTLPPLPLAELLLIVLTILLWRILLVLREGLKLLQAISARSEGGDGRVTWNVERAAADRPRVPRTPSSPAILGVSSVASPVRSPSPGPPSVERFLRISAELFADCLLDQADVDTSKFIRACRHFGTVLEKAGPFTMLSIRETQVRLPANAPSTHLGLLAPSRFDPTSERDYGGPLALCMPRPDPYARPPPTSTHACARPRTVQHCQDGAHVPARPGALPVDVRAL